MKTAIVLGATGGLGKSICKRLLSDNYNIIGSYHSIVPDNVERMRMIPLEIRDKNSIDEFISRIDEDKIDLIIVGLSTKAVPRRFLDINSELLEEELRANVVNQFYLINKLTGKLSEDANIIFILTEYIVGETPKYLLPYVCSKYALLGIMRTLSQELKDKKIRVNSVSPGMMETGFTKELQRYVKENYAKKNPFQRLVKVEEVVNAIEFLINSKITGENISVFGEELKRWKSE